MKLCWEDNGKALCLLPKNHKGKCNFELEISIFLENRFRGRIRRIGISIGLFLLLLISLFFLNGCTPYKW